MHFHLHTLLYAVMLSATATIGVEAYAVLQTPEPLDPAWVALVAAVTTGILSLVTAVTSGIVLILQANNKKDTDQKLETISINVDGNLSKITNQLATTAGQLDTALVLLNADTKPQITAADLTVDSGKK